MEKVISGKSVTMRIEMRTDMLHFGEVATCISQKGGDIIAIDVIQTLQDLTVRDLTIQVADFGSIEEIASEVRTLSGVRVIHISDRTFLLHLGGKIEIRPKTPIQNRDDLSRVYTPDVARVCMAIHEAPDKAHALTIKRNTVAVVSDGSAVLGLGNIGPKAALPVMEGKAMLFKQFAGVDAFPICLDTQDTDEIVRIVKGIAPAFGGINLEDIAAPRCFEIERRLREELDIPVFHDDQHGTAVVILAGLLNALKIVNKSLDEIKVIICGVGAAGVACGKMLLQAGARNVIGVDRQGALNADASYGDPTWQWFAEHTNPHRESGALRDVIAGADVFIGLSAGGIVTREMVASMAAQPIVFAMANPHPEIMPHEVEDLTAVMATGRSDYPNQINNVLCFPGMFQGVLRCRASCINEEMKLAAAEAIASVITDEERNKFYIIPSVFNDEVVSRMSRAVMEAALRTKVAGRIPREFRTEH